MVDKINNIEKPKNNNFIDPLSLNKLNKLRETGKIEKLIKKFPARKGNNNEPNQRIPAGEENNSKPSQRIPAGKENNNKPIQKIPAGKGNNSEPSQRIPARKENNNKPIQKKSKEKREPSQKMKEMIAVIEKLMHGDGKNEIQAREKIYTDMIKEKLSPKDYNSIFSGAEDISQGAIGDCYLIAAINVLHRCPYFETLIRTSLKRVSGRRYILKMPLGEPQGREIYISQEELEIAKVKGNIGYKILEIGFAKYILKMNGPNKPITEGYFKEIKGGLSGDALQTILGPKSLNCTKLGGGKNSLKKGLSGDKKNILIKLLKSYDLKEGKGFITTSSLRGSSDSRSYNINQHTLYCNHAYSVLGVEKHKNGAIKYIDVLNPWNNNKKGGAMLRMNLNDFLEAFSHISIGKLTGNFLNLKTDESEIKIVDARNRQRLNAVNRKILKDKIGSIRQNTSIKS